METRRILSFAVLIVTWAAALYSQQPSPRGATSTPTTASASSNKPPAPTARVSGRVVAADTGRPLRLASVTLMAQPSKVVRITLTDAQGRYEFTSVAAGRYGLTASKEGYVFVSDNPFSGGRGVEILDGQNEEVDFSLARGSVITGRITDEFGEPVAGVTVQAARYQFRPSGERQLMMGSSGNYYMPSSTNDRGEFRIFGLRPGSYYVSARAEASDAVGLSQGGGGLTDMSSDDGLAPTFYPGTTNLAEAQSVRVDLAREASVSFALVPARMARVSGTVRNSQGQPVSNARVMLTSKTGIYGGWFGDANAELSASGEFTLANVAPGEYLLDVRPGNTRSTDGRHEFATVPISVGGEDIAVAITTSPGITVSGRMIFEGESHTVRQNLRVDAIPEEDARNMLSMFGGGEQIDGEGRFSIPGVFGRVVFRVGGLPINVMLKSVTLNGVDITNSAFDATTGDDITDLRIVVVDKQARIFGYARDVRGEIQTNYRIVVYPTHLKQGDVTVRFQHNASPNVKGQFNMNRMPPGEYVALAVKGVQPGEEWDPELRKRIEQLGKRFTLKEGETLDLEVPYVE